MTDHTINENETDNIMEKKENENLEDLFAEVEQLIAHMEEDISLDESFVCYEQGMKKLKHYTVPLYNPGIPGSDLSVRPPLRL